MNDVPQDQRYRPEDRIMQGVIPYFAMPGKAGEAADFYMKAFAAKDIGRMPFPDKPGFMHIQVEINGGALMLTDEGGMSSVDATGNPMPQGHLQLVVPDGQAWWGPRGRGGMHGGGPLRTAGLGRYLGPFDRPLRHEMGGVDTRSRSLGQGVMTIVESKCRQ